MPPHHPVQNHLLAALAAANFERLRPELELVPMPLGWVVYESGSPQQHVYFPANCVVSLLYVMSNGASAKIALAGKEGLVGIASFMGGETTTGRAVVQSSGYAYRMEAESLKREFARGGQLRKLALRYTQALIVQMTQTAVCHRHHTVEQQLCRWLLLTVDRLPANELLLKLDLAASILGTGSERILQALARLQARGLVRLGHGTVSVVDRPGLEDAACECYAVVTDEYDRLLATGFGARRAADGGMVMPGSACIVEVVMP